jgi:hypothetical protein
MSRAFEVIDFFNYIGKVKEGQTLFIKKRKYVTRCNLWYKFLRKCYKEDINYQEEIINSHLNLYRRIMDQDLEIPYIINNLNRSLINLKKGITTLFKTYNEPEGLQILLRSINYKINRYIYNIY